MGTGAKARILALKPSTRAPHHIWCTRSARLPQELCTCSLRMAMDHGALDNEDVVSALGARAALHAWCALHVCALRASWKGVVL